MSSLSLVELLAPVTPEAFFANHYDKAPLHVTGGAAKFATVLSWRQINRLLDMTHIWSSQSLKLVMDGAAVPPEQYCARAVGRDAAQLLQPEAARVQDWIRRGASVVMNDVDSLTPGLASVSDALEAAGLGKAQANVYISWQSHKAFPAHFDTHDVWAVQVEGEKTWNLWTGRADWPIAHPMFRNLGQAHHEQAKGKLMQAVTLKPGDLLYLPRGWYHDALADAPASVHVAYGVSAANGMDVLNILMERALHEVSFRQPLPRQDGSAAQKFAFTQRVGLLGQKLAEFSRDPKVLEIAAGFVAGHRFQRGGYGLPGVRTGDVVPAAAGDDAPAFRVLPGARLVRRGPEQLLKTDRGSVALAEAEAAAAQFVLARPDIDAATLRAAHPGVDAEALIARMQGAGVLAAA